MAAWDKLRGLNGKLRRLGSATRPSTAIRTTEIHRQAIRGTAQKQYSLRDPANLGALAVRPAGVRAEPAVTFGDAPTRQEVHLAAVVVRAAALGVPWS